VEQPEESQPASVTPSGANPHNLAKQLTGLIFWLLLFTLPTGRIGGATLALLLGGVTFADAWRSGIYKWPGSKSFLNMSPMAWGLCVPLLFVIAYPLYLAKRNKLRTIRAGNGYFVATIVLGACLAVVFALAIVAPRR
jgi:hypothetical protein